MRRIILFSVIQQLLYPISRVESLMGQNLIPIRYGEFPFIASFQYIPGEHNFCEGALVAKKHVLTAAYCLANLSPERFRILFEVADAQGPAVAYTAASWITFNDWADGHDTQLEMAYAHSVAIVTLTDNVYHINPVPLNELTKSQLYGAEARMIGRRNDVLSKATVKFLNDDDCERKVRQLRNTAPLFNEISALCSAAEPFALLNSGDMGSPLLDARDDSLLGIAFSLCPGDVRVQGNFTTEFIRQRQVNIHYNVDYYRVFIYSIIPAAPGA